MPWEPKYYILLSGSYPCYGISSHLFSCENFQPKCLLSSVSDPSVLTFTIAVAVMGDGGECGGSSSSNMAVQPGGSITLPMVITIKMLLPSLRTVMWNHTGGQGGRIQAIIHLITRRSWGVVHFTCRPPYTTGRQPAVHIRFNGPQKNISCPLPHTEPQYTRPQPITSCTQ